MDAPERRKQAARRKHRANHRRQPRHRPRHRPQARATRRAPQPLRTRFQLGSNPPAQTYATMVSKLSQWSQTSPAQMRFKI